MARLTELPSIDIIRGFKGVLDFYLWRGLPCVRSWPRTPKSRQTEATKAAALLFGQVLKNYRLLADMVLVAYQDIATGTPRTARDVYVSGAYGHLHEAAMSDFLTLLTNCRDSLLALEALLGALGSVDTDDLQVDVKTSALPAGASTLAEQQTQSTALAKIDDLQDALESKALDRLLVRGMDQVHSFQTSLNRRWLYTISGANGYINSDNPAAGIVWHITRVGATNRDNPITALRFEVMDPANPRTLHEERAAFGTMEWFHTPVNIWLTPTQYVRVYYIGGQAGDGCYVTLHGEIMTLET